MPWDRHSLRWHSLIDNIPLPTQYQISRKNTSQSLKEIAMTLPRKQPLEQKGQALFKIRSKFFISSLARVRSRIDSCSVFDTHTDVSSLARCNRVKLSLSRRSVFTRSPVLLGISDSATTMQPCPIRVSCRKRTQLQGPAS